jgi:hypothetical protein
MLLAGFMMFRGGAGAAAAPDGGWPCRCMPRAWLLLVAVAMFRHHQEGRAALAERGHHHPAQRDPEDRHAADAGLVVPEAARASCARSTFCVAGVLLAAAGRADHEAA